MFVKVIYVRCRAQPTLHHCVVIWAGEGVRYVCEAIGERLISSCDKLPKRTACKP